MPITEKFEHSQVLDFARKSLRNEGVIVFRCDRPNAGAITYEGFKVKNIVTFTKPEKLTRIDLKETDEKLFWQENQIHSENGDRVSGGIFVCCSSFSPLEGEAIIPAATAKSTEDEEALQLKRLVRERHNIGSSCIS